MKSIDPSKDTSEVRKLEYHREGDVLYEVELIEKSRRKVTDEEKFIDEVTQILGRTRRSYGHNHGVDRISAINLVRWLKERPNDYTERLSKLLEFIQNI